MTAAPAEQTWVPAQRDRRRWVALAFIAVAQLMIALDATIVSIALPSAQAALGASDADRQWVVTAYTLAFGRLRQPTEAGHLWTCPVWCLPERGWSHSYTELPKRSGPAGRRPR